MAYARGGAVVVTYDPIGEGERNAARRDGTRQHDRFIVITNGRRTMPAYKYQVVTADRWAIIAYVRLLQRAAHGTVNEVPGNLRAELK